MQEPRAAAGGGGRGCPPVPGPPLPRRSWRDFPTRSSPLPWAPCSAVFRRSPRRNGPSLAAPTPSATLQVGGLCPQPPGESGLNAVDTRLFPSGAPPPRVAGRYAVEAVLGAGGMGTVFRVHDDSTGATLALKRLLPTAGRTGAALFRREYHTLMLLKHPRIVEVYDYGLDEGDPYYTMELLDGTDLKALAPLGYRDACAHLRDVASSLALLAAHRLVHRDLSAANVPVTSDGRSERIDFGALSPFGVTDAVVGTAPYLSPEALRGLPLDQRTDLFALGALASFLLTRTHAFPARSSGELESAWLTRPGRPSVKVRRLMEAGAPLSPVPRALDDLVLSLLSLDPLARPQNAAEVIDRLTALGALESEPGPRAAEGYLLSAKLVGRAAEMTRAKVLLASAVEGSGAVLTIRHGPGAGGTRLLTEMALEARLAGATVLRVDGDVYRAPHAVMKALAQKLTSALPAEAKEAAPADLNDLGWVRPHATDRPSSRHSGSEAVSAPLAMRLRIQLALERWFLTVAEVRPLALFIDNVHQIDEVSAAFLASLAVVVTEHPIALIATLRAGDPVVSVAPIRRFAGAGETLDLSPLSAPETRALVESLFGDVPNTDRLPHWVHGPSGGKPLHLMELSQDLVSRGIARYVGGRWALPSELPSDLPSRLDEAQVRRLAGLGETTMKLASGRARDQ